MNGQFVVECSVVGQQTFNAKNLSSQGLDTDPDGWFQFSVTFFKVVEKFSFDPALDGWQ
jgi:hypothetical protein